MGKRSKRGNSAQENNKIYIIAGIIAVVLGVVAFSLVRPTGQVVASTGGEYDEFASCLTEEGAIFYGTEWCGFCQQQKDMFGESMELVDFIDCDQNRNVCTSEGIRGYPTWKIDGQLYSGVQQLTRLSELTGCEL